MVASATIRTFGPNMPFPERDPPPFRRMIEPYGDGRRLGLVGYMGEFGHPVGIPYRILVDTCPPCICLF